MTRTGSDQRLAPPPRFDAGWPRYLDPQLIKPRDAGALVVAALAAITFDVAVRAGIAGVGGALAILVPVVGAIASGRVRNPQAIALLAAAPLFGMWLVVRASGWLLPLDVIAACGLVLLACSLSAGGSLWDLSIPSVAARATQSVVQAVLGPVFLFGGTTRPGDERRPVAGLVRGVVVAIPVLLVLGVLLASADAVFASFVDFDLTEIIQHGLTIAFAVAAMAGLLRLASLEPIEVPHVRGPKLGPQEWTVVLVLLNAMLGTFAAARLVALSEGGRRIIETAGLTYSEYARSGFFQLLAVAGLVVGVVAALRATAELHTSGERTRFRILSLGVVVLTIALVASAFHRLLLYEQVFGLTMLRLYAQSAIVFVGLVLAYQGLQLLGVGERRAWVWSAAGVTALVMLFAMNVLNPEAFVVRHNVAHQKTTEFDPSYLNELGDDAVPEIAKHPQLGPACAFASRDSDVAGWAAFNMARDRATDIATPTCEQPRPHEPSGG